VVGLHCGSSGSDTSGDAGCQQVANGGSSLQQCTCAAMSASPPGEGTNMKVVLVESTTSDQIDPDYDLGLPAGTAVCFVGMTGQFTHSSPAQLGDASVPAEPYAFAIFTESPWSVVEAGETPTQPTPSSE
jgi:hypothetical protein